MLLLSHALFLQSLLVNLCLFWHIQSKFLQAHYLRDQSLLSMEGKYVHPASWPLEDMLSLESPLRHKPPLRIELLLHKCKMVSDVMCLPRPLTLFVFLPEEKLKSLSGSKLLSFFFLSFFYYFLLWLMCSVLSLQLYSNMSQSCIYTCFFSHHPPASSIASD